MIPKSLKAIISSKRQRNTTNQGDSAVAWTPEPRERVASQSGASRSSKSSSRETVSHISNPRPMSRDRPRPARKTVSGGLSGAPRVSHSRGDAASELVATPLKRVEEDVNDASQPLDLLEALKNINEFERKKREALDLPPPLPPKDVRDDAASIASISTRGGASSRLSHASSHVSSFQPTPLSFNPLPLHPDRDESPPPSPTLRSNETRTMTRSSFLSTPPAAMSSARRDAAPLGSSTSASAEWAESGSSSRVELPSVLRQSQTRRRAAPPRPTRSPPQLLPALPDMSVFEPSFSQVQYPTSASGYGNQARDSWQEGSMETTAAPTPLCAHPPATPTALYGGKRLSELPEIDGFDTSRPERPQTEDDDEVVLEDDGDEEMCEPGVIGEIPDEEEGVVVEVKGFSFEAVRARARTIDLGSAERRAMEPSVGESGPIVGANLKDIVEGENGKHRRASSSVSVRSETSKQDKRKGWMAQPRKGEVVRPGYI